MSDQPKKKILILDDDKFLLSMYSAKFTAAGVEVDTVETGEELLTKLRDEALAQTYNLILLDIIVPGVTGLDALEIIRKENLAPQAKIIMLTNETNKSEIERAESFNINGYIVKAMASPSEVVEKGLAVLG